MPTRHDAQLRHIRDHFGRVALAQNPNDEGRNQLVSGLSFLMLWYRHIGLSGHFRETQNCLLDLVQPN